jgi:hypothetical protein
VVRTTLGLAILLACAGCGDNQQPMPDGMLPALASLSIMPASASFAVVNGAPATGDFTAVGTFTDGSTADVTGQVAWTIVDAALGAVDASGHYVSGTTRGGSTVVRASDGTNSTEAAITLDWTVNRVSLDDGATTPADAQALFQTGTPDPTLAPQVAYPLDQALVPTNLGGLEVQWKKPSGPADLFEVSLRAPNFELVVYTNALQMNGGRISLAPSDWAAMAGTVAGGTVEIAVRGTVAASPGKIGESNKVTLRVGKDDVQGGIYYWAQAPNVLDGVYRKRFGDPGPASAFYTRTDGNAAINDGGTSHCVSCHVLSRDGTKMAVTYDGVNGAAALLDVASKQPIVSYAAGAHWNFASLSPDGTKLVGSHNGVLTIYSASSGSALGTVATGGFSTHPDWSPDGNSIVYVRGTPTNASDDSTFTAGSLFLVTSTDGVAFGTEQLLVASQGGANNYYPSFSPDGQWVLFNRSTQDAYNDNDARLYVVRATPGSSPIRLLAADGTGNLANSFARFSPVVLKNGDHGDLLYFTFASTRDYGIEMGSLAPSNPTHPQIWMAAFDPSLAAAGMDGSAPAFWLPFQDVGIESHLAQWTTQIVGSN